MRERKAAMEMSVGTIVTIVLLMGVLVLGIFLIQKIFKTGTSAIDQIDVAVQNEINKLFTEEGSNLIIYPSAGEVTIKKGDNPKGFAFSVKNADGSQSQSYTYTISAQSIPTTCGTLTKTQADNFIIGASGQFSLGPGNSLQNARLVRFTVPKTAPSCSFFYEITITGDKGQTENAQIFVTIK
ncbi:hypothetical protein DRN69_00715 [Candidatus Pacearchaeota archaeon]|nr:MAG: hypothetical protein DRN69_00715 [Candidatus Pacearchaeota archaeon]